jgi:hypothetical protein
MPAPLQRALLRLTSKLAQLQDEAAETEPTSVIDFRAREPVAGSAEAGGGGPGVRQAQGLGDQGVFEMSRRGGV